MPEILLTGAISNASGSFVTALGSFTKAQLDAAVSDGNVVYVGSAFTLSDALFTLQDDGDPTKLLAFQLSGITGGTTVTLTPPNASGTIAILSGAVQTFGSTSTFSSTFTHSGATGSFGTATSASTYGLGTGANGNGVTKAINIGTAGVSGSTTTIAIGSSVSGALGTVAFGQGLSLVTFAQPIKVTGANVSSLPSASTAGVGARHFALDALTPVFGATVVGGGAVPVPVYSDGTNWKVG